MNPAQHWIVTADTRRASLFSCTRSAPPDGRGVGGELHVEHVRTLEIDHGVEHEHHRPALIGGAERRGSIGSSGARAAPHSVAAAHEREEQHRRFAREVGIWIGSAKELVGAEVHQRSPVRLTVFAPPHMCGPLREQLAAAHTPHAHKSQPPSVEVREAELAHLRASELAVHPAVVGAMMRHPVTASR